MPLGFDADLYGRAFGQLDGPVHWPSLTTAERAARTVELRDWVRELVARFDIDVRVIPAFWQLQNWMVEGLSVAGGTQASFTRRHGVHDRRGRLAARPPRGRSTPARAGIHDTVHGPGPPGQHRPRLADSDDDVLEFRARFLGGPDAR